MLLSLYMFDNKANFYPDDDDTIFCEFCGRKIEETQLVAEGTEFEKEVMLCEECFEKNINHKGSIIL